MTTLAHIESCPFVTRLICVAGDAVGQATTIVVRQDAPNGLFYVTKPDGVLSDAEEYFATDSIDGALGRAGSELVSALLGESKP